MIIAGTLAFGAKALILPKLGSVMTGVVSGSTASGTTAVKLAHSGVVGLFKATVWLVNNSCTTSPHGLVGTCPRIPV